MKKDEYVNNLRSALQAKNIKNTFEAGDIAKWKEGLRKRGSGYIFIVMEVTSDGNHIELGEYDSEGLFRTFYEDAGYFEPYIGD